MTDFTVTAGVTSFRYGGKFTLSFEQINLLSALRNDFDESYIRNVPFSKGKTAVRSNNIENKQCVGFVKNSRADLEVKFGAFSSDRARLLKSYGFHVDSTPRPGTAFVMNNGHVGMVEDISVSPDGKYAVLITDYNANDNTGGVSPTGDKRTACFNIDNSGDIISVDFSEPSQGFIKSGSFSFVHEKDDAYQGKINTIKYYIKRLYDNDLLKRVRDAGGLVEINVYQKNEFISRFLLFKKEHFSTFLTVISLYKTIFGRGADISGLTFQIDKILSGTKAELIVFEMCASKEGKSKETERFLNGNIIPFYRLY